MKLNGYTKFVNCRLLRGHQLVDDQLWVKDGKIIDPHEAFYVKKLLPARVIDCQGAILSPGLIDLQINGKQQQQQPRQRQQQHRLSARLCKCFSVGESLSPQLPILLSRWIRIRFFSCHLKH